MRLEVKPPGMPPPTTRLVPISGRGLTSQVVSFEMALKVIENRKFVPRHRVQRLVHDHSRYVLQETDADITGIRETLVISMAVQRYSQLAYIGPKSRQRTLK